MTRAIWINEGAEVGSYERLKQLGMTHVFWSARTHTRAHIVQARTNGFQLGLYANPQWQDFPDPKVFRDWLNRRLTQLSVDREQCDVQINYEQHEPNWIIDFFHWWRRVRATRETSWTMEGHQAGWAWQAMNHPNLLGNSTNLHTVAKLVPQAYDGSMNRWDSWGVVKDLVDYGVSVRRVLPFYDAPEAATPYADGFFYMEHRLG